MPAEVRTVPAVQAAFVSAVKTQAAKKLNLDEDKVQVILIFSAGLRLLATDDVQVKISIIARTSPSAPRRRT